MISDLALSLPGGDALVTLDASWLSLLLGVILPLLVGLATTKVTSSNVQRSLLLALSIVGGALTEIAQHGGTFRLKETLLSIAVTYFTAQTSYSAVLKPFGVADAVKDATAGIGVTIKADPAKVAAVEGEPSTALATGNVNPGEIVVPVDTAEPDPDADTEPGPDGDVEDATDLDDDKVPYDVEPDPDVAVIDPADLPSERDA